jgi:chromosome segregation ATPase
MRIERYVTSRFVIGWSRSAARERSHGFVLTRQNSSEEVNREFEAQIAKLKADLEKVVPNMKAIERLADVQTNLEDAEREADQTRRDSKRAKDKYQDLRKRRSVVSLMNTSCMRWPQS